MLVALTGPGLTPASADQFTPLEDPPSIVVVGSEIYVGDDASIDRDDFTALGGDAIVPAFPRSGEVYNVFTELSTNGDLENVTEIRLCLYDSADVDFKTDDTADETKIAAVCGIEAGLTTTGPLAAAPTAWTDTGDAATANFDPTKVFVMRWLVDEDGAGGAGFRVEQGGDTVNYENAGSAFTPAGLQTATAKFSFKVSNAMQVSSSWKIRVAAESVSTDTDNRDPKGQSAQDLPTATFEVAYFGHMSNEADEVRPSVEFGVVVPATTASQQNLLTGHYTANDASSLTIRGTDFVYDDAGTDRTIALASNGDIDAGNSARQTKDRNTTDDLGEDSLSAADSVLNVKDGEVSLDCAFVPEATVETDAASFIQVRTDGARIFATSGISATGESLKTDLSAHTCLLSYRGQAPVANQLYTNTVIMGLIQGTDGSLGGTATDPFESS
jgi:hypothetical protein